MTSLVERKSRLVFETSCEVRAKGRYRQVVIEARPEYAIIRLKGIHSKYMLPWDAIHDLAARLQAEKLRREKAEKRKKGIK